MNKQEADKLVMKCKMLWGNPFKVTTTTAMDWAQAAADVSYESMDKALDSFANEGDKFPPSLAELVSRARSSMPAETWAGDHGRPVCNWCGGPYWSGPEGQRQLKSHYNYCASQPGMLTMEFDESMPQYDAPGEYVPMPVDVKQQLRSLLSRK